MNITKEYLLLTQAELVDRVETRDDVFCPCCHSNWHLLWLRLSVGDTTIMRAQIEAMNDCLICQQAVVTMVDNLTSWLPQVCPKVWGRK